MIIFTYSLGMATALAGMAMTHTGVTFMGFCLCVIGSAMAINKEKEENK